MAFKCTVVVLAACSMHFGVGVRNQRRAAGVSLADASLDGSSDLSTRRRRRRRGSSSPSPSPPSGGGPTPTPTPTPHQSGCLEFLLIGDYGTRNTAQRNVASAMAKVAGQRKYRAVLAVGDNIYPSGAEGSSSRVESTFAYYYKHSSLRIPWYVVAGNHDWYTDANVQRKFTTSSRNKGNHWQFPSLWYRKSFSGPTTVEVFFIDTMVIRKSSRLTKFMDRNKQYNSQKSWLESRLKASTAKWKVVVGHHPIYSAGRHGGSSQVRSMVDSLMRRYGASVVFAGHDHSSQLMQHKGVSYIVSGAGGAKARDRSNDYPSGSLREYHGVHSFGTLSICSGSSGTLRFYSSSGRLLSTRPIPNGRSRMSTDAEDAEMLALGMADETVSCDGVSLSGVDQSCSADDCTVVADSTPRITCAQFCAESGMACVGGWTQEEDMDCKPYQTLGCHGTNLTTRVNIMCKCARAQ